MKKPEIKIMSNAVDRFPMVNGEIRDIHWLADVNKDLVDALMEVRHTMKESRLDNDGVLLGDRLEAKIETALKKAGCE